jgi:hypothetical protein
MQPLNLQIQFIDGKTEDVSTTASDYIKFETHFDRSITALGDDVRLTYLFFLAWSASKRNGQTELDFDSWSELVAMVGESEPKK